MYEDRIWETLMRECPSLVTFNRFILPLAKNEEPALKQLAANEAIRRGYKFSKDKGVYE
jgi:hypothetical protein